MVLLRLVVFLITGAVLLGFNCLFPNCQSSSTKCCWIDFFTSATMSVRAREPLLTPDFRTPFLRLMAVFHNIGATVLNRLPSTLSNPRHLWYRLLRLDSHSIVNSSSLDVESLFSQIKCHYSVPQLNWYYPPRVIYYILFLNIRYVVSLRWSVY